MKTAAKAIKPKTSTQKDALNNEVLTSENELKTDPPLSEKDEVKQAEEKLRKGKG